MTAYIPWKAGMRRAHIFPVIGLRAIPAGYESDAKRVMLRERYMIAYLDPIRSPLPKDSLHLLVSMTETLS